MRHHTDHAAPMTHTRDGGGPDCQICSRGPTGLELLPAGLVSLVVPRLVFAPRFLETASPTDPRSTPLDTPHAPPGPPPRTSTSSL
jgi:hypothetical protein